MSSSPSPSTTDPSVARTADAAHQDVAELAHERERTSRAQYAKAFNPARTRLDPAASERGGGTAAAVGDAPPAPPSRPFAPSATSSPTLADAFGSLAADVTGAAEDVRDAAADVARRGAIDVAATSRAITEALAAVGKDFQATPAERREMRRLLDDGAAGPWAGKRDARLRMAVAAAIVVALLLLFAQRRERVRA